MAKKKKRFKQYRDGLGRYTTKERHKAEKEIVKQGVIDRKTGKKIKVTKAEAARLIHKEKIKETATGEKNINTFENEMEYFFVQNPEMLFTVILPNGKKVSGRGEKGFILLQRYSRKIWRENRNITGESRPYPVFLSYSKESFPGDEIPIHVTLDLRDITTVEGDPLFNDEQNE